MNVLSRSHLCAIPLTVLLTAALTQPCFGQWQELGNLPNSLDKAYINVETVSEEDGLRVVLVKTVYPEPRPNKSNITLDSHIQETAFDCENKKLYEIQLFGYLNGKLVSTSPAEVATSPLTARWKTGLVSVGSDSFSQHVLSTACTLQVRKVITVSSTGLKVSFVGEMLMFAPPKDFKLGYHVDRNSMREYVPNGETVDNWTEILTVQIFRDLKPVTPAAFLHGIGKRYLKSCPDSSENDILTGNVNGYVVSMLALKCPRTAAGEPENTVFRAIRGKDALYVVQHAWRTAPSDNAKQAISTSSVCDTRGPEHPCPHPTRTGAQ